MVAAVIPGTGYAKRLEDGLIFENELRAFLRDRLLPQNKSSVASGAAIENITAPAVMPERQSSLKHVPKQRLQESSILEWLRAEYRDPKTLPKPPQGKPGPKSAAWAALGEKKELFQSRGVFDKAWERLRASQSIQDAE
jgi:hypothetical protein